MAKMNWQELKEALGHAISTDTRTLTHLRRLHGRAIASGLRHNPYISTLLITAYFSFNDAATAQLLLNTHRQNRTKTLLHNSLIRGYLRTGSPRSALRAYQALPPQCHPDKHTFHLAITACNDVSEFDLGERVGELARRRGLDTDRLVSTALISLYSNAGDVETAREVFDRMTERDAVAWNAMISGYSRAGFVGETMGLFRDMRFVDGVVPGETTLVSVISGCGLGNGKGLHAHVIKIGYEEYLFVSNSLMAMYIDCDCLDGAEGLFARMGLKDAVSWSTMIGGYVKHDRAFDALRLFHLMVASTGISPTRPVLLNVLQACADLGDWKEGKRVEEKYLNGETCEFKSDASLVTAVLYMYAKSGKMEISTERLNKDVRVRGDVITWNAVIKACAELGQVDLVLELTLTMQRRCIVPDTSTFLMLLPVISSIPSLEKGMETHAHIIKRGFELERTIANSLIDVYGKSGCINDSIKVYNGIREKDVVSWSTMIKVHAWNGNAEEALKLFQLMRKTETRPNRFTFVAVLSACSHAGFIEKGKELFEIMMKEYGLEPDIEHLGCLVDMLCRAGLLSDAFDLIQDEKQKACSSAALWGTLLSASRVHGESVIGEVAAKHLFDLEPGNAANYLMLADIYTSVGRREDANVVLRALSTKGLEKRPGCSRLDRA